MLFSESHSSIEGPRLVPRTTRSDSVRDSARKSRCAGQLCSSLDIHHTIPAHLTVTHGQLNHLEGLLLALAFMPGCFRLGQLTPGQRYFRPQRVIFQTTRELGSAQAPEDRIRLATSQVRKVQGPPHSSRFESV